MKKLEVDLAKKTMQLENLIQEVNMKVKSLEEELNDDDDGGQKSEMMKDSQGNFSGRESTLSKKKGDKPENLPDDGDELFDVNSAEDDRVNIGITRQSQELPKDYIQSPKDEGEPDRNQSIKSGGLVKNSTQHEFNAQPSGGQQSVGSKQSIPKIQNLRQSRNRRAKEKMESDMGKLQASSNSPANKKSKKRGTIVVDKDSKDMLKQFEQKIEELRKSSYNEINRLESMMEKDLNEQRNLFKEFTEQFNTGNKESDDAVNEIKSAMGQI